MKQKSGAAGASVQWPLPSTMAAQSKPPANTSAIASPSASVGGAAGAASSRGSAGVNHQGRPGAPSHEQKKEMERYMAAFNSAETERGRVRLHHPTSSSGAAGASLAPVATSSAGLPRADISFANYQAAAAAAAQTTPAGVRKPEPQQQQQQRPPPESPSGALHLSLAEYAKNGGGGGVIVAPGEGRDMRMEMLRIESHRTGDPRSGGGERMERPPLSFKPYEHAPRAVVTTSGAGGGSSSTSIRTSRSPLHLTPPSTTPSACYPMHYSAASVASAGGSSRSNSTPSAQAAVNYMPPPSPSRSPSVLHQGYPNMRYSPAPQTPIPSSTSPGAAKKSSPIPLAPHHQSGAGAGPPGSAYARSAAATSGGGGGGGAPAASAVQRNDQPLSLITPLKSGGGAGGVCGSATSTQHSTDSGGGGAPPPAHSARTEREVRMYPRSAYSPLAHPLPPPSLRSGGGVSTPHQQQPLDLGTYRDDSGAGNALISSARLNAAGAGSVASTGGGDAPVASGRMARPPPPELPLMNFPSLGIGGIGTMMSVATLVDAINAQGGKPPRGGDPAGVLFLGLTPPRPPSVPSPPIMSSIINLSTSDSGAKLAAALLPAPESILIKSDSEDAPPPAPAQTPTPVETRPTPAIKVEKNDSSRSSPILPAGAAAAAAAAAADATGAGVKAPASSSKSTNNNSSCPKYKLKTAWLQRHTGGDDGASAGALAKNSSAGAGAVDVKAEALGRSSPALAVKHRKPLPAAGAAGATASRGGVVDGVNGSSSASSPQTDNENTAPPPQKGGNGKKAKAGAPGRLRGGRKTPAGKVASNASAGSSSEDGTESDTDSRTSKGRTTNKRPRKDSGGSSGLPTRPPKGNPAKIPDSGSAGANSKASSPFNKPPIAQLKKTGESFLQVRFRLRRSRLPL